jgi:hypothetical protein
MNSKQKLKVSVSKPYGIETIYPECECARLFAKLLGQKTLTRKNLEIIKCLGYEIEQVFHGIAL